MSNKPILAGLYTNKTGIGEAFRRNVTCFKMFCDPDIYDLSEFTPKQTTIPSNHVQYAGPINHDLKYFHLDWGTYKHIKSKTQPRPSQFTKKVGYFVWESSELQTTDIPVLKDFDEIWTASNYCKNIFSQYIDSSRIKVVPHPVSFATKPQAKYKKFTILIVGNISSDTARKNFADSITAAKLFKQKHKKVDIVLKTNTFSLQEKDLLKNLVEGSNIEVIDMYYSQEELQRLMSKCHVVLSLHRSEGFGLTLAESLACNTLPIATGYSGNTDFLDPRLLVDYTLQDTNHPVFPGQWANPSIEDCLVKMESLLDENLYKTILKENQELIKNQNSFESVSSIIKSLVQ